MSGRKGLPGRTGAGRSSHGRDAAAACGSGGGGLAEVLDGPRGELAGLDFGAEGLDSGGGDEAAAGEAPEGGEAEG